ncbi:hypothetical protein KEJ47_07770 [Candidatus Bathyarchaeota archaeon]|nr:hypothetical protein [Candidatus Bathyarchaeota archaeon]
MFKAPVRFKVDETKAIIIAKIFLDLISHRRWLVSMPEYQLPRNLAHGSQEHALYLTYVISIDYMTNAEKLWSKARGAYELYPEKFTPEKILEASENSLRVFLRGLGARFDSSAAKTWKEVKHCKGHNKTASYKTHLSHLTELCSHIRSFTVILLR